MHLTSSGELLRSPPQSRDRDLSGALCRPLSSDRDRLSRELEVTRTLWWRPRPPPCWAAPTAAPPAGSDSEAVVVVEEAEVS